MAKTHQLAVTLRKDEGKGASRRLRRTGSVPAVVYGGGKLDPVSIQIAHKDVYMASQNEWFYSAIIDLSLGGDVQKVLLRDMQRHPFKQQILHLDFLRINEDEAIRVRVPLHFINADVSPGVKLSGGMVQHVMTDLDVRCLAKDLPAFIEVDLKDMDTGHSLHVSHLVLPAGVEAVLHKGEDPVVATILVRGGKAEEEVVEEEVAPAAAPAPAEKKSEKTDKR